MHFLVNWVDDTISMGKVLDVNEERSVKFQNLALESP